MNPYLSIIFRYVRAYRLPYDCIFNHYTLEFSTTAQTLGPKCCTLMCDAYKSIEAYKTQISGIGWKLILISFSAIRSTACLKVTSLDWVYESFLWIIYESYNMSHPNVKIHSPLTPALLPFVTYKHVTYNMYVTQLHKCVLCNYDVMMTSSFTSILAAYALHLRLFVSVFLDLASLFPFDVFAFPPAWKGLLRFGRIDNGFRVILQSTLFRFLLSSWRSMVIWWSWRLILDG